MTVQNGSTIRALALRALGTGPIDSNAVRPNNCFTSGAVGSPLCRSLTFGDPS